MYFDDMSFEEKVDLFVITLASGITSYITLTVYDYLQGLLK